tara:strand:+ start:1342 stop:1875 length:534 start_codon:yes stop_codon:yes gene_type:complete
MDFWATDQGQIITGAHRYIRAARVVRFSKEAETQGELLKVPVLHLLAHGMELLFKYPILRAGSTQAEVSKRFGHHLWKLWMADQNANFRRDALQVAQEAWSAAAASQRWPNDDFSADPQMVLLKAIQELGHLHGRSSSFALRYTLPGPTSAPRPAFLIETFGQIAERSVKDPSYLDR